MRVPGTKQPTVENSMTTAILTRERIVRHELQSVDILGVRVNVLTRDELTRLVRDFLESDTKGWISYLHVHALNLAVTSPWLKEYLNDSLVTYCDGEGVRLGAKLLGYRLPKRIVMTEWIHDVCRMASERGYTLFFLGGTAEVNERATEMLMRHYPDLKIVGSHPGYLTESESSELRETMGALAPDILIVGMGMPLQERWVFEQFDFLNVRLVLTAGSCFDFLSGFKRRCPQWMAEHGLEWMYRFLQEPRRLWRRYWLGNPMFVYRVLRQRLQQ